VRVKIEQLARAFEPVNNRCAIKASQFIRAIAVLKSLSHNPFNVGKAVLPALFGKA